MTYRLHYNNKSMKSQNCILVLKIWGNIYIFIRMNLQQTSICSGKGRNIQRILNTWGCVYIYKAVTITAVVNRHSLQSISKFI